MSIERRLGLAFSGALAVLVGLSLVSLLSLNSLRRATDQVNDARAILARVDRVVAGVKGFETCRRLADCRAELAPDLAALRRLVADKPAQHHRFGRFEALLRRRFATKSGSERLMEGLLRLAAEMKAEEESFLRLWLEEKQAGLERTFRLMGLGGALSVLMLAAAGWRLRQDLRARRLLERELANFFSLSVDLLCVADLGGRFTRLSPSWEKVLGWSLEELTAKPFAEFLHPDDRARTAAEVDRVADGAVSINFENRYLCRDGSYRWLSWCAAADRESRLLIAVARDATVQKETQRLREELARHVNHDLRSPAATLEMTANMLLSGELGEIPEPLRPFLGTLTKNAAHLRRMIEDLLDVVRSETGKLAVSAEEADLAAIVRETAATFESLSKSKGIALSSSVAPGPALAYADPARLRQVLTNLVDNAMKFTPQGGEVRVRATPAPSAEGFFQVSVSDTGRGIPPEYQDRVFERHYQVPGTPGRGLGLGLTICRDLISRQGGKIWVESEVGKGTTFHFTVPTAKG